MKIAQCCWWCPHKVRAFEVAVHTLLSETTTPALLLMSLIRLGVPPWGATLGCQPSTQRSLGARGGIEVAQTTCKIGCISDRMLGCWRNLNVCVCVCVCVCVFLYIYVCGVFWDIYVCGVL